MALDSALTAQSTYGMPTVVSLPGYTMVPTGGRVFYVRSTGRQSYDPPALNNILTTLGAAMNLCRANSGDVIICLPGHSESITASTTVTFVAGVRVIGAGNGFERPTFRWTNTAGQFLLNVNNVSLQNLVLRLEGASGVTKAILITGTDCSVTDCDIETVSGSSNKATIAIEIGGGSSTLTGSRTYIARNLIRGTTTASTDVIKIVGSTVPDAIQIISNRIQCAATAASGLIDVTVAATNLIIHDNLLLNSVASGSTVCCINVGAVAASGFVTRNLLAGANSTAGPHAAGLIVQGSGSIMWFAENYCVVTVKTASGVLAPAADSI